MTRTVQEINREISRLRKAGRRRHREYLREVARLKAAILAAQMQRRQTFGWYIQTMTELIWRDFPWADHPATGLAILMAGVEATPFPDFDSDAAFAAIDAAIARVRRNLAMGGRS